MVFDTPKDNEKKVKTGLIFREKKDTKKSVNDVLGKNQMKYRSYFKIRTPMIGGGTMAEMEKEVLDYFKELFMEMKSKDDKVTWLLWRESGKSKPIHYLEVSIRRDFGKLDKFEKF